ncbi:hypothetical protein ABW20_dc0104721 [Dactylellina cionopaga]|nr:hypothetical protein ABW20_dc0104721 [Dactylellina cionopaga]
MAPAALPQTVVNDTHILESISCNSNKTKVSQAPQSAAEEWPKYLESPLAWDGNRYDGKESEYTYNFLSSDVEEIEAALRYFEELELDGRDVSVENFPLPTLGAKLKAFAEELHRGRGFFVLSGLDPKKYTPENNALIFLGLSSYIGEKRGMQNTGGDMITHISDAKKMKASQTERPARDSNIRLLFHTDAMCDIVGLQSQGSPAWGGRHVIASGWNIYNELAAHHADVIEVLAKPNWAFKSDSPPHLSGQKTPILHHNGRIFFSYTRKSFIEIDDNSGDRSLTLTPEQIHALDTVQGIAEKNQLSLPTLLGDMIFVNNFAMLHSRERFEDNVEAGQVRHLIRMWLKNESLGWDMPEDVKKGNLSVFTSDPELEKWEARLVPKVAFTKLDLYYP